MSGGDLLKEPCKYIKEQSPDRVGTCQLQRYQVAECVSVQPSSHYHLMGHVLEGQGLQRPAQCEADPSLEGEA